MSATRQASFAVITVAAIAVILMSSGEARACQCVDRLSPARAAAAGAPVVVEGFVTRGTNRESLRDSPPSRLVVSRAWAGAKPGEALEIDTVAGSCTAFLDKDASYVIYAARTPKGKLEANACSVMSSAEARASFGAEMGPPPEPPRAGCGACAATPRGNDATGWLVALAFAALALVRVSSSYGGRGGAGRAR